VRSHPGHFGLGGGCQLTDRLHTPVQYLEVHVEAGGRVSLPVPARHNGFVLVLEGALRVGPELVTGEAAQVLWLDFPSVGADGASTLEIRADVPSRGLVVSGEPIREPVVAYGPFVMNTEEEIVQAYRDFHNGTFGGPTPVAAETSS
jgi:quercetin 2,3-dioxygenase